MKGVRDGMDASPFDEGERVKNSMVDKKMFILQSKDLSRKFRLVHNRFSSIGREREKGAEDRPFRSKRN